MCQPLSSFLCCLQLHKCIICYFHDLKSILNDHSFKKYISPVVFIDLKYAIIKKCLFVSTGCLGNICYNENSVLFQLVAM